VLDNAGHTRSSDTRTITVGAPAVTIESPAEGANVRGAVRLSATTTPEHSDHVVTFQRRVGDGDWANVGTPDSSSPVYTAEDDISALGAPDGTDISYRAVLNYGEGTTTSAERTVNFAPTPVTAVTIHYRRPAADYGDWGVHLWGDAIAPGTATAWESPRPRNGIDTYGAYFTIPITDDTKPLNFIVHRPAPNADEREPGGDRSFIPLDRQEIWLKQGDPAIYFSQPPP
jgi:hypothetical protein